MVQKVRSLFFLVLTLILCLLPPAPISSNCGFRGYSFINPNVIDRINIMAPFILNFESFANQYALLNSLRRRDNIGEWRERFCNRPKTEDIAYIVYAASLSQLQSLKTAIASRDISLTAALSGNTFARFMNRFQCTETIDYLIYAKLCEPHVTEIDPWVAPPRNIRVMEDLIQEGLNVFLKIESHYIRLRYAYQMIRLAHYAGLYERTLELYDYLMPKIDNDPSIIEYWIEGHRAGALLALGDNVKASYIYSQVFQHCASRRQSALQSFRIRTDEEWKACLLLCRDDRERATLHAMRAYARDSRAVEEMREIYRLDPANINLELLLVKEITELEKDLLGLEFNRNRRQNKLQFGRPRDIAGKLIIDLQQFVSEVVRDGSIPRPDLWLVASGYLEMLAGDYYSATRTFSEAKNIVSSKELARQLEVFELALLINSWQEANDEVEKEADYIIRRNDLFETYEDFPSFLHDKLYYLYQSGNQPGKAFITEYPIDYLRPNPKEEIIDDLLLICNKQDPTKLETKMIEEEDGTTIEQELIDMKATVLFADYRLEEALATLRTMDRSQWDRFGLFNPFVERITDCVHCPLPDTIPVFNRGELIQQMLDMEYEARANPEMAALHYYRLGVAFYNMTYFGYAWKAMDYYRSGASMSPRLLYDGDNIIPHNVFPYGNREHFDCSRALYYFLRARAITNSPELAARATFWASKCERNDYYVKRANGAERTYQYFDELVKQYAGTNYYRRVYDRCLTFRAYADR